MECNTGEMLVVMKEKEQTERGHHDELILPREQRSGTPLGPRRCLGGSISSLGSFQYSLQLHTFGTRSIDMERRRYMDTQNAWYSNQLS
jgi:hypothetical protein